jgi:hypothetical protein
MPCERDPSAADGEDPLAARGNIRKAHADFVMALAGHRPRPIACDPEPEDFSDRAIYCEALIGSFKVHLAEMIEEAAENDPTGTIRDGELPSSIDAHLGDLSSDIAGTLARIADRIRDNRYDLCPRGPFHRRRRR